jgi:hypothetical protein
MIRQPKDAYPNGQSKGVRAARIFSNVVSPPSVYAFFAFVLAWTEMPFWRGSIHAAIFGLLTSLMPILYLVYLLRTEKIEDIHISNPGERHIPYILGILGAAAAYFIIRAMGSSQLFLNFILTNIVGLSALALINIRWLISAHVSSITMIAVFSGFAYSLITGLAIAPIVALTFFVRYYLKRHTIGELISGLILGIFLVTILAFIGFFA